MQEILIFDPVERLEKNIMRVFESFNVKMISQYSNIKRCIVKKKFPLKS